VRGGGGGLGGAGGRFVPHREAFAVDPEGAAPAGGLGLFVGVPRGFFLKSFKRASIDLKVFVPQTNPLGEIPIG
jgi:hypothetical protein